jgi:hypothetical protein
MASYLVNSNSQSNGDHEVHVTTCTHLPIPSNQVSLGSFDSCRTAVAAAKAYYSQSNGCRWCCPACHTT